jgi:hypothetical protein
MPGPTPNVCSNQVQAKHMYEGFSDVGKQGDDCWNWPRITIAISVRHPYIRVERDKEIDSSMILWAWTKSKRDRGKTRDPVGQVRTLLPVAPHFDTLCLRLRIAGVDRSTAGAVRDQLSGT